jgi:hypothetical protein
MMQTEQILTEFLSSIGYARQTLRFHPEKVEIVEKYLSTVRLILVEKIEEHQGNFDILSREICY